MPRHAAVSLESTPRPTPPQVAVGTTGVDLVHMADKLAWLESQPDGGGAANADVATAIHDRLLDGLDGFRAMVADLDDGRKAKLNAYLDTLAPDLLGASVPGAVGATAVDRLLGLDAADTVSLLRRDVAVLELQTHDMQPFLEGQKELFVFGVRCEVAEGRMSPAALCVIESAPHAEIRIGGWWQTQARGSAGEYNSEHDYITVEQGVGANTTERAEDFRTKAEETIPHELFHREFKHGVRNRDIWLKEAMAEHVALSLRDGEMDVFDPDARTSDSNIYRNQRLLTAEMMEGIEPALLTRAVTSRSVHSREWRELSTALRAKYGIDDMVPAISERIRVYEELLSEQSPAASAGAVANQAAHEVLSELRTEPWRVTGVGEHVEHVQVPSRVSRLGSHVTALIQRHRH